jgi:hypothetical protein
MTDWRLRPNQRLKLPAPVLTGYGDVRASGGVEFRL